MAAFTVKGLYEFMCRELQDLSFHGMFAKGKQREGVAIFALSTLHTSNNFILSYGQLKFKKPTRNLKKILWSSRKAEN
jgi:hypothetical protein